MNRKAIKQRGKAAFKANYWKTVLVAFLLALALGTIGANVSTSVDTDEINQILNGDPAAQSVNYETTNPFASLDGQGMDADFSAILQNQETYSVPSKAEQLMETVNVGSMTGLAGLSMLLTLFLFGPLEVSCRNFLKKNLKSPAELEELNAGFVPKYWHNLATMLLRRVFLTLWTLLFIIPGIIMSYAYEMTPYILNDHPELGAMDAIRRSKEMMKGHKWELFVLDLSFLGWFILSILTLGILDVFYVHPYYSSSHAAFYEALKAQTDNDPAPEVTDLPAEA